MNCFNNNYANRNCGCSSGNSYDDSMIAIQGPQWVRGDAGPKGDQGAMGIQGIQGNTGPKGDSSSQGPIGLILFNAFDKKVSFVY